MAQNTRVQKYQKLRDDIEHMDDPSLKNHSETSASVPEKNAAQDNTIPDSHPQVDTITRGAMSIPLDEIMKKHTKITNDDSFLTEEQSILEDTRSKRWSIIGTVITVLIIVSLVIGIGILLWKFLGTSVNTSTISALVHNLEVIV